MKHPIDIDLTDPKRCVPGESCAVDEVFGNPPMFIRCPDIDCDECICFHENVIQLWEYLRDQSQL